MRCRRGGLFEVQSRPVGRSRGFLGGEGLAVRRTQHTKAVNAGVVTRVNPYPVAVQDVRLCSSHRVACGTASPGVFSVRQIDQGRLDGMYPTGAPNL